MNIRIGNLANPIKVLKHAPHVVLDAHCSHAAGIDHVIVKLLPENLRCVESVCNWIAHDLGLAVPPQYLVRVTADKLHRHCTWPYGTAPEAMAFATRVVPYARTIDQVTHPAIDAIIANWKQLELAAVFDHLIANDDRSEKNLLIDAQRQLWLIDHARSLGGAGQRLFSQDVFPSYKNFLLERLARMPAPERLARRDRLIRACVEVGARAPRVPYDELFVSDDLRTQIHDYLSRRAVQLQAQVLDQLGIPDLYCGEELPRSVQ